MKDIPHQYLYPNMLETLGIVKRKDDHPIHSPKLEASLSSNKYASLALQAISLSSPTQISVKSEDVITTSSISNTKKKDVQLTKKEDSPPSFDQTLTASNKKISKNFQSLEDAKRALKSHRNHDKVVDTTSTISLPTKNSSQFTTTKTNVTSSKKIVVSTNTTKEEYPEIQTKDGNVVPSKEKLIAYDYNALSILIDDIPKGWNNDNEFYENIMIEDKIWNVEDFNTQLNLLNSHCTDISTQHYIDAVLYSMKKVVPIIQESVLNEMNYYDHFDDDDVDDEGSNAHSNTSSVVSRYTDTAIFDVSDFHQSVKYKVHLIKTFLCKLKSNVFIDLNIRLFLYKKTIKYKSEKHVYCPCCENMKHWRQYMNIIDDDYFDDRNELFQQCPRKSFSPEGLVAHLYATKCTLHRAMYWYLFHLYNGVSLFCLHTQNSVLR